MLELQRLGHKKKAVRIKMKMKRTTKEAILSYSVTVE